MEAQFSSSLTFSDVHERSSDITAHTFLDGQHPVLDQDCAVKPLDRWKTDLLHFSLENTGRAFSKQDVVCFSEIFDSSAISVRASLDRFQEESQLQKALGASEPSALVPHSTFTAKSLRNERQDVLNEVISTRILFPGLGTSFEMASGDSLSSDTQMNRYSTVSGVDSFSSYTESSYVSTSNNIGDSLFSTLDNNSWAIGESSSSFGQL